MTEPRTDSTADEAETAAVVVLLKHRTVATGLGEWCCSCSPMQWRALAYREQHVAHALRASGVLAYVAGERP